jgi:hypothetical protein
MQFDYRHFTDAPFEFNLPAIKRLVADDLGIQRELSDAEAIRGLSQAVFGGYWTLSSRQKNKEFGEFLLSLIPNADKYILLAVISVARNNHPESQKAAIAEAILASPQRDGDVTWELAGTLDHFAEARRKDAAIEIIHSTDGSEGILKTLIRDLRDLKIEERAAVASEIIKSNKFTPNLLLIISDSFHLFPKEQQVNLGEAMKSSDAFKKASGSIKKAVQKRLPQTATATGEPRP